MSGFYDEDGLFIHTSGVPDDVIQLLLELVKDGQALVIHDREVLIQAGYNPDTGEYNA